MAEPNPRFQAFLQAVGRAPIIPVLTIERPAQAAPLARALAAGGVAAIEITLRRPGAPEAIAAAAEAAPELLVGAGTVLDGEQLDSAAAAGARFAVSPGATPALLEAARGWEHPFLPGVASASEVMAALAQGFRRLKFFPAAPLGGPAALKALAAPFPEVGFCPTGGISRDSAADYLRLDCVFCLGGSWIAPEPLIEAEAWDEIAGLARESLQALKAAP
ncbi:MAG: bifunctional 4-hydroxy-2-oxoglutarate aldolase/2-dehydro-3-deoxy-phosphogluconate aldolase [Kiloniellales bacterium]|nr:bifunctional 4-hydroxy-2-oxoglutarate aldolase/2-dehydro-3-deoxy-phosphogluconate aldolase [Kiloniellales bacterium]